MTKPDATPTGYLFSRVARLMILAVAELPPTMTPSLDIHGCSTAVEDGMDQFSDLLHYYIKSNPINTREIDWRPIAALQEMYHTVICTEWDTRLIDIRLQYQHLLFVAKPTE